MRGGCLSRNNDHFLAIHQKKSGKPAFIYHHSQDIEKSLDIAPQKIQKHSYHSSSKAQISKRHQIVNSAFPRPAYDPSLNLLAMAGQDLEVENLPIPAANVIVVTLQMDVNRLNITLLRIFRQGVAAALGLLPQQVHINRLIGKKNSVELFVSPINRKAGISDALPSEEVLRSLNINVLHQSLSQFGITEVSPEKNVLQGQHEADKIWSKEGFYAVVIFLSIFVIIVTCLMILYRLKEKFQLSLRQDKEKNQEIHLSPIALQPAQSEAKTANSLVQPEQVPKVLNVVVDPEGQYTPEIKATTSVCPSPFKMKPIGLQERPNSIHPHSYTCSDHSGRKRPHFLLNHCSTEYPSIHRRGSNVSLTLDMSSLGNVEPFVATPTPREKVAMEYLQSASRILTRSQLRDVVASSHLLQSEFMEIPMNFVDPKEIDIPCHGTKNRYKTILPNPLSRVCLRPKNVTNSLSTYINANYIRGYSGKEKAFIATQGPMINTVNDFWQMVWQEDSPVIVMITKLKEKNEKCVLYWPEKRGIYGKVEVLVINVNECDNYTVRNLVLKQGSHTQHVKHYWYTSWPDHKTPASAQPLLQLMLDVEEDRLASVGRGPVVVHCSAGIGRTGCFIATSIGCRQLREEGVVDALSIVCQLRVDRGGMVQTSEQYEFLHHALCLYESRLAAETVQ
ncbi:receptor-type tyrosine-protein phosphatase R isoform X2 [Balaenoptera ricei]|uniref:receptor-type tyrosine-protein phosphatase R isoform X2 n=1 Tax=Balaenoptera ricei TaxID=2746895 RepID=UPI0028BF083F|nr:receptor-type tyrosine-protein phosphatase R isoform X2 [Balaenoptera ricei]